jgi:hypothetical protein
VINVADELDPLKGLIHPTLYHFWQGMAHPVLLATNAYLNLHIGVKSTRIGVFGPYPDEGTDVVLKVAQMVAEQGFNAITGLGTYTRDNPNELVGLLDNLPTHLRKARKVIPDRVLFHELAQLVSKAIFFENDERGQYEELTGCCEYKVSSLAFIRHRKIFSRSHCEFLEDKESYTECSVSEPTLCPHMSKNHFCPFYDSINLPWFSKEILLSREHGNRLVAIRSLPALKKIIREFVGVSSYQRV